MGVQAVSRKNAGFSTNHAKDTAKTLPPPQPTQLPVGPAAISKEIFFFALCMRVNGTHVLSMSTRKLYLTLISKNVVTHSQLLAPV